MSKSSGSALLLYRDTIPQEVRDDLKQRILEATMYGYEGLVDILQFVIAHTVALDIPPEVAKEVRGYLELLLTAIAARNLEARGKDADASNLAKQLQEDRMRTTRTRARVELEETPGGLTPVRETVTLEVPWKRGTTEEGE